MAIGDPVLYDGYLGGHEWVTHVDRGVLEICHAQFNIKSMIDIGCGPGGQVREAMSIGIDAVGIDGDPRLQHEAPDLPIVVCDFTKNQFVSDRVFDLAWSCEFVEHVEEKFVSNFMTAFQSAKFVVMTFAPPGTPGHHHVNCRTEEYWKDVFSDYSFKFLADGTQLVRAASSMQRDFIRNNGLMFSNNIL